MSFINLAADCIQRHAKAGKFIFYLPTASYEVVSRIAHQYLQLDPSRGANAVDRPGERPDMLKDFSQHANEWRSSTGKWCGSPYPVGAVTMAEFSTWSYQVYDVHDAGARQNYADFLKMVAGELLDAAVTAARQCGDAALLQECLQSQKKAQRPEYIRPDSLEDLLNRVSDALQRQCEAPAGAASSVREACRAFQKTMERWTVPDEKQGHQLRLSALENTRGMQDMRIQYGALTLMVSGSDLRTENPGGTPLLGDIGLYIQYQTAMQIRSARLQVDIPLFLYGEGVSIPSCMEPYTEIIEIQSLEADDIRGLVRRFEQAEMRRDVELFYREQLSTCTLPEARIVLQDAYATYGTLLNLDKKVMNRGSETLQAFVLSRVSEMLNRKISLHGKLCVVPVQPDLPDPVGMDNVIQWYEDHKKALKSGSENAPKGLLLTGVPGCGKTYFASWMAQKMGVKLLRLDMSAVLGSLMGQSEANIAEITNDLERCGSFILLVDEVEKALAGSKGNESDGGVMTRVTGKLLEWLQDRRNRKVFVIFTANDMSKLPPELRRSGRLDARFIVLCPRYEELIRLLEARLAPNLKHYARSCIQKLWEKQQAFMTGADVDLLAKEIQTAAERGNARMEIAIDALASSFRPQLPSMDRPEIVSCYQSYFVDSYMSSNRAFSFDPTIYHRNQPILYAMKSLEKGAEEKKNSGSPYPIPEDALNAEINRLERTLQITYHDYDRKLLKAVNRAMGQQIIRNVNEWEASYISLCENT